MSRYPPPGAVSRVLTDERLKILDLFLSTDGTFKKNPKEYQIALQNNRCEYSLVLQDLKNAPYLNRLMFAYTIGEIFNDNITAAREISQLNSKDCSKLVDGGLKDYLPYMVFESEELANAWIDLTQKKIAAVLTPTTQDMRPQIGQSSSEMTNGRLSVLLMILSTYSGFQRFESEFKSAVDRNHRDFNLIQQDLKNATYYNRLVFAYTVGDIFNDNLDAAQRIAGLNSMDLSKLVEGGFNDYLQYMNFQSEAPTRAWLSSAQRKFSAVIKPTIQLQDDQHQVYEFSGAMTDERLNTLFMVLSTSSRFRRFEGEFRSTVDKNHRDFNLIKQDLKSTIYYDRLVLAYTVGDIFNDNSDAVRQISRLDPVGLDKLVEGGLEDYVKYMTFETEALVKAWLSSAQKKLAAVLKQSDRKLTSGRLSVLKIILSADSRFNNSRDEFMSAVERGQGDFTIILQDLKSATYYDQLVLAYTIGDIFNDNPDAAQEIAGVDRESLIKLVQSGLGDYLHYMNFKTETLANAWLSSSQTKLAAVLKLTIQEKQSHVDESFGEGTIAPTFRQMTRDREQVLEIVLYNEPGYKYQSGEFEVAAEKCRPNFDLLLEELKGASYYDRLLFAYEVGDIFIDNFEAVDQVSRLDYTGLTELAESQLVSYVRFYNMTTWAVENWRSIAADKFSALVRSLISDEELEELSPDEPTKEEPMPGAIRGITDTREMLMRIILATDTGFLRDQVDFGIAVNKNRSDFDLVLLDLKHTTYYGLVIFAYDIGDIFIDSLEAARRIAELRFVTLKQVAESRLEDYPGALNVPSREAWLTSASNKLFHFEPSAALMSLIRDETLQVDEPIRAGVLQFFRNQPYFNIREESVNTAANAPEAFEKIPNREEVLDFLRKLQRTQALSRDLSAIPILMRKGLTSAVGVSFLPLKNFISAVSPNIPSHIATSIHGHAVRILNRNESAMTRLLQAVQGTRIAALDGNHTAQDRIITINNMVGGKMQNINLAALFGDMDTNPCDDCSSVTSPAAYFVEILEYLRSNNLEAGNINQGGVNVTGITGTVLEHLFARRPDLGDLQLSCPNTNAVLPYLDLANEVMESFVVHLAEHVITGQYHAPPIVKLKIDVYNTGPTDGELLSEPQHTNHKAYSILSNQVYPFNKLPYDQPLDEVRIFLKYLGTSRHELIETFRETLGEPTSVVEDRAIVADYLNLSHSEYVALTGQAFQQKEVSLKEWEYWGYWNEEQLLDKNGSSGLGLYFVDQFLPKSGVQLPDLIDLLRTAFINPSLARRDGILIFPGTVYQYSRPSLKRVDTALTLTDYARFRTFLQLQQKLGWKTHEVDGAISACSPPRTRPQIDSLLLAQLVSLVKLLQITRLELPILLTFWSPIGVLSDDSLYSRLFLTPHITGIDPIFRPDDEGNYLSSAATISQHQIVILATLGLTTDGLDAIRRRKMVGDELSVVNLSTLYRHAMVARFLKVTPSVLFQVIDIFGDPFESPTTCLGFLDHWKRMGDAGFSFAQLNYILRGIDDPLKPLSPSDLKINTTIQSLIDGQATHPKTEDTKKKQEEPHPFLESLVADLINTTVSKLFGLSIETTAKLLSEIEVGTDKAPDILRSVDISNTQNKLKVSVLRQMARAAILIKGFKFTDDEVKYVVGNPQVQSELEDDVLSLRSWNRLISYVELRNSLPKTTDQPLSDLFHFPPNSQTLSKRISALILVKQEIIDRVLARFGTKYAGYYVSESVLTRLKKACDFAARVAVDVDTIFRWANPLPDFQQTRRIALEIRGSIRAQSTADDWASIFKPMRDQLRHNQREALVAYLLVQKNLREWGVTDADSLFEFFLIDVQMGSCLETSRIKQAISSVQLFVQRCFCGLEARYGVANDALDRKRWEWMQKYRLWEANRKVFLYPENWIEPSLRDDKSPPFQEFEADLMQRDLNTQSMQDAVKNYVSRIDEVANLRVVALYVEELNPTAVPVIQRLQTKPEEPQGGARWIPMMSPDGSETGSGGGVEGEWSEDISEGGVIPGIGGPEIDPPLEPEIDPPLEPEVVTVPPKEGGLVHFFARSRAAPFSYYYRMFDWTAKEWKPWEKMDIDIQNHEEITAAENGGTFLIPVVMGGRLIVFTPQMVEKKTAKETVDTDHILPIMNNWEIKLGWSEYRNGKWTTKKLSTESLSTKKGLASNLQFHSCFSSPEVVNIIVGSTENTFTGVFKYTGGRVSASVLDPNGVYSVPRSNYQFNATVQEMLDGSLVDISINIVHQGISGYNGLVAQSGPRPTTISFGIGDDTPKPFHHQFSSQLLTHTTTSSTLNDLYTTLASVDPTLIAPHELEEPYALYHWELGLHAPMLLMEQLASSQQYEKALEIAHYIFDPLSGGSDVKRVWKWAPFKEISVEGDIQIILDSLDGNISNHAINNWRNAPFQPHVVARDRPIAYMKWVVMKYISILIASGDQLFRQNTLESVPLAIQYYTLAAHLYGPPGQKISADTKNAPKTYNSLLLKWDAFSNAMIDFESAFPFVNLYDAQGSRPISRYFCVPDNPNLRVLRTTIDDRLYKIRHCQDINGYKIKLALFEPPIDPGALVRAAAEGISLSSFMQNDGGPMPNYRFRYLLQKAFEMVHELRSLGDAFLAAKEKKDSQSYELLRIGHESTINGLLMDMKKLSCVEANKTLDSLLQARNGPLSRLKHYAQLVGEDATKFSVDTAQFDEIESKIKKPESEGGLVLTAEEKSEIDYSIAAAAARTASRALDALATGILIIPTPEVHTEPLGFGLSLKVGPKNIAEGVRVTAIVLGAVADSLEGVSVNASKKANLIRQFQDRVLQANSAGHELENINAQIQAQQVRVSMTEKEIELQQKQIDSTSATQEFLHSKYTNEALYSWQETQIRTLYYQTYTLTYDLAKKVEKSYRFERGLTNTNFIQESWDANRDGLFSAEGLNLGLKRLEAAHQENRGYEYEITKHVSLRQVNPTELLKLRELGSCQFSISEKLFDMDFPGHYNRRIKSISLSIPCVIGPYTGINCTMELTSHKYRISTISTDYLTEEKFRNDPVPIKSVAISSGQNDSGVFELNFQDERYIPFEGAGAISDWRLELPSLHTFDYRTITDAILHIRYTSIFGGQELQASATESYAASMAGSSTAEGGLFALFDLKNEFANEWYRFGKDHPLALSNLNARLPYFTRSRNPSVTKIELYASNVSSTFTMTTKPDGTAITLGSGSPITGLKVLSTTTSNLGDWDWELQATGEPNTLGDLWMIVRYTLESSS